MTRRLVEPIVERSPGSETAEVPDALPTGHRVGPYRLLGVLGSGGMATVYLASLERGSFQKIIALKRIHPHLARDATMRRMFADEARIASQIAHPNVCQVFDVGESEGVPFLAMEYVPGETVDRIGQALERLPDLRRNPRFWCFLARIIADAAEGLHAAHEARAPSGTALEVVHRDIKPSNLIVSYASQTKVMDFGIAHATVRGHVTQTGELKGSLAYMAPEQAAGQAVDRRADLWSLGVVLWELLAARVLFDRQTAAATFQAVLRGSAPPVSVAASDVPGVFVEVTARALERDPARRYRTGREFRDALDAAALQLGPALGRDEFHAWMEGLFPDGQSHHSRLLEKARARGMTLRKGPWPSRRRLLRFGGGVALVVMGVAVGATGAVRWRSEGPEAAADGATSSGVAARDLPAAAAPAPLASAVSDRSPRQVAVPSLDDERLLAGATTPTEAPPVERSTRRDPAAEPSARVTPSEEFASDEPAGDPAAGPDDAPPNEPEDRPSGTAARIDNDPSTGAGPEASEPTGRERPGRRPRGSQRATMGSGTLLLVARGGWGRVFLRGRPLGETPLRTQLPAGRHQLEVRFASGARRPVTVRIRPGRATRVSINAR